jgi:hypothetical protein
MRMTEPLPNCFSIWPNAAVKAFLRFSSIRPSLSPSAWTAVQKIHLTRHLDHLSGCQAAQGVSR